MKLDYHRLGKADKGLVKRYLGKVTGMSRAQLTRLIHQHRASGMKTRVGLALALGHVLAGRPGRMRSLVGPAPFVDTG